MKRVRFDVQYIATRQIRQLDEQDVISIEVALRYLLRSVVSDEASIVVEDIGANTYRVTLTFDLVSVDVQRDVVGIVSDPTFDASLSTYIGRFVRIVSPVMTIVETVFRAPPPPPRPPPPSPPQLPSLPSPPNAPPDAGGVSIIGLSAAVVVVAVPVLAFGAVKILRKRKEETMNTFAFSDSRNRI